MGLYWLAASVIEVSILGVIGILLFPKPKSESPCSIFTRLKNGRI